MITADLIVLITIAFCLVGGAALGFGRWLKILTGGVVGRIISVVICYFLFGIVLNWYFVQEFMLKITTALQADGSWICKFLLAIRIDMIAFAAVLFIIVQILRKFVVYLIANFMMIDNKVISVINRILGIILISLFLAMVMLIVFQVVAWVLGTDCDFYHNLQGSVFGLDRLFIDNPLNSIIESIRLSFANGNTGA